MKAIFIFILSIIFALPVLADNILLKNGIEITNVKILKQNENWVFYQKANGQKSQITTKAVLKIERAPFIPLKKSSITKERKSYSFPDLKLLTISAISFALSYDYFAQAHDIQKNIDFYKSISPKDMDNPYSELNKDLKNQKKRKQIIGAVFVTAGLINFFISLNRIQIKASTKKLTFSYKF